MRRVRTNFEPLLAECLRIILNAEFGTSTVDFIVNKAQARGTYWEDAARTLDTLRYGKRARCERT